MRTKIIPLFLYETITATQRAANITIDTLLLLVNPIEEWLFQVEIVRGAS